MVIVIVIVSSLPYSHRAGICDEVSVAGAVVVLLTEIDRDREMDERTLVYFVDHPLHVLEAYVENGEGFDRAGGFAVQVRRVSDSIHPLSNDHDADGRSQHKGLGSVLIRKIDGNYNNVVGFPGASFFQFLDTLVEEEEDFLQI